MNLSIVLGAICLCAGCASTPNTETEDLASDTLLGHSQPLRCGSDEVTYCQASTASRLAASKLDERCGCMPRSAFSATVH